MHFAGSVKWLGTPFDARGLAALRRGAAEVPGFAEEDGGLAVVSLSGTAPDLDTRGLGLVWRPEDVVAAWRAGR